MLEAGGTDRRFWIKTPIGYGRTFADPAVNWKYQTAAESRPQRPRASTGRAGRVVGGSSSINALVYCRGMPADFDDWRRMGNVGWGWDDVRPYFERSERHVDPAGRACGGGPLDVKDVTPFLHPMRQNWSDAADGTGLAGGRRISTARIPRAWVAIKSPFATACAARPPTPSCGRRCGARNVRLETGAWVSKIRFDQRRAVGVDYVRGNAPHAAAAAREVILCGGAVNSPQLLQLSGIGPAATLAAAGITPLLDNPAVGGHLQDHLAVVYSFKATQPTLNDELHSTAGKLIAGLRYLLARRGPLALSVNQFGGFARADAQADASRRAALFQSGDLWRRRCDAHRIEVDAFSGFYLCFQPTRPTSVGRIDIAEPGLSRAADDRAELSVHRKGRCRMSMHGGRLLQAIARTQAMQAADTRTASRPISRPWEPRT